MNDRTKHMDRSDNFIRLLLDWKQALPGRGLPWTRNSNPYMIWISEIMLQQTRAQTVVPYFERFINEFPDIGTLADAPEDQVLGLWAGLGYYARARNLHAAARYIRDHYDGQFPDSFDEILNLPGVGRSTAGAICALAYGMRTPILDGNAKRVYSRFFCIDDDSESERNRKLWEIADIHTPEHQSREIYTANYGSWSNCLPAEKSPMQSLSNRLLMPSFSQRLDTPTTDQEKTLHSSYQFNHNDHGN